VEYRRIALESLAALLEPDELEILVGKDDKDYGELPPARDGHLSGHHEEASVAGDAGYFALGAGELGRYGCGYAEAHRGAAVRHELKAGGGSPPGLADEVGMGAYVAGHDAVGGQDFSKYGKGRARAEAARGRGEVREHFAPAFGESFHIPVGTQGGQGGEPSEGDRDVPDDVVDIAIDAPVYVGFRGVQMEERHLGHPILEIELHGIVAYGDDEIGLAVGFGDLVAEGVEKHTGVAGMIFGNHALGHGGEDDGNAMLLGDLDDQGADLAADGGKSQGQDGSTRLAEHRFHGGEKFLARSFGLGGGNQSCRNGSVGDGFAGAQVLGKSNVDRSRHFGHRDPQGLVDGLVDPFGRQPRRPLREGTEKSLLVDGHLHRAAYHLLGRLAGQGYHGRTVQEGSHDPGAEVRRSGSDGAVAYGGDSGKSGADIGHESGAGLIAHQDEIQALLPHGFHIIEPGTARYAKNEADSLFLEFFHQLFGNCRHIFTPICEYITDPISYILA